MILHYVAAIDPGIDDTSVAVFRLPGPFPCAFEWAVAALDRLEVCRTKPSQELATRLMWIRSAVESVAVLTPPVAWYVELPTAGGTYHRYRGKQRTKGAVNADDLSKLYLAIGTIAGGILAHSSELVFVPPPRLDKQLRRLAVTPRLPLKFCAKRLGQDAIDAIYLGAAALSSGPYTAGLRRPHTLEGAHAG